MRATFSAFPTTRSHSILHDIDVIKRELPVDLLEFFYLTPLPGSEDHLKLFRAGAPLDPDMNKYDLNSRLHDAPAHVAGGMGARLQAGVAALLHHPTTSRRCYAALPPTGANASNALFLITWFKGSIDFERIHPLEGGFLRLKFRRDRRPGLPIEPAWQFYPRY